MASAICAWAPLARVRRLSIPCATARRFSKSQGISIETLDLSEVLGRIERMKDNDDAAQAKLAVDQEIRGFQRRARSRADEDGQARRRGRSMDGSHRSGHQRRAVLDLDRRKSGRGALHRHEHDERQSAVERLRSGHLRRARHARSAAGVGNALARCSTGTTTTAPIPTRRSASTAPTCPSISSAR